MGGSRVGGEGNGVPIATGGKELVKCRGCEWLSIGSGEHKVMQWVELDPPLIQECLQLWVDVRRYDHGGPFPVGLAGLVVPRAVPNDPAALFILEQSLPYLQLPQSTLPA